MTADKLTVEQVEELREELAATNTRMSAPTPASGETPRTDARLPKVAYTANDTECELGEFDAVAIMIDDWREMFELARQLERELAEEKRMRNIYFTDLVKADDRIRKLEMELIESDNDRLRAIGLYDSCKAELAAARSATDALRELHVMVWGECPSLLNEDSGGDAALDLKIRELIASTDESSKT